MTAKASAALRSNCNAISTWSARAADAELVQAFYIPGYTITPTAVTIEGATGRIIRFVDAATGASWSIAADGSLKKDVIQTDLRTVGVDSGFLPVIGAVLEVTTDSAGRAIRYTALNGDQYQLVSGAWQKVQNAADVIAAPVAAGMMAGLPFVPATVIANTPDGRGLLPVDQRGRPWIVGEDDRWRPLSDGRMDYDFVVYGTGLAGLMAMARAARRGLRVCVIEPYSNFGGMHANGMSYVDTPAPSVSPETLIQGGLTQSEYFALVTAMEVGTTTVGGIPVRYAAQCKTYEMVAQSLIAKYAVRAIRNCPIEPPRGVLMGYDWLGRIIIRGVWTPHGLVTARQFSDCSYEADVMAGALGPAGYTYGREATSTYGEAGAGYAPAGTIFNLGPAQGSNGFQFYTGSGSVPAIGYPFIADPHETVGAADQLVQSYNFRVPFTRNAANRIPFIKPSGYNNKLYLSYLQFLKNSGYTRFCRDIGADSWGWQGDGAGGKVNWNGADLINHNVGYADGNWNFRGSNCGEHVAFQQGLMWCVQNDPIVLDYGLGALQADAQGIGLCADEFEGSQWGHGWPYWLYARETRRLKRAMYVMTLADITAANAGGTPTKAHSIGKWSYYPDIHMIQGHIADGYTDRIVVDGAGNSHSPTPIYQMPLEAIIPAVGQVINLTVPFCAAYSHLAWAPQRLEIPTGFCGEAAGELAAWLIENPSKAAQDFDYPTIAARLTALGSKL